jgi:tetratricopeptide (TPR) repeat protein
LWGAIHKRLWDLKKADRFLDEAIAAYERGFYLKQDHYNGINLAYLLNVRADREERAGQIAEAIADFVQARRVRTDVIRYCEQALANSTKSEDDKYWIVATLWEAAVGLDNAAEIAKWQQEAELMNVPKWMRETTQNQLTALKGFLASSPLKHLQRQAA